MLYETILKTIGVSEIREAADGISGYTDFVLNEVEVVIMSYSLPRRSGLDTLLELKGTKINCKVIMLTSENDKKTVMNCIKAGADYFIQKDLSVKELKQKLQDVFNKIL